MLEEMTSALEDPPATEQIDNLVYETFVRKFNDKYSDSLLSEQRDLLNRYISSFIDGGLELKVYLNEEIARLKVAMAKAETVEEISTDPTLVDSSKRIAGLLESFAKNPVSEEMIEDILKIQKLTAEITSNAA